MMGREIERLKHRKTGRDAEKEHVEECWKMIKCVTVSLIDMKIHLYFVNTSVHIFVGPVQNVDKS